MKARLTGYQNLSQHREANPDLLNPTERVEPNRCLGQSVAAMLTVDRGVYEVGCIVI